MNVWKHLLTVEPWRSTIILVAGLAFFVAVVLLSG